MVHIALALASSTQQQLAAPAATVYHQFGAAFAWAVHPHTTTHTHSNTLKRQGENLVV